MSIRIARALCASCCLAALTACAVPQWARYSPEVTEGTVVELDRALSMPAASRARVFVQNGRVTARRDVDEFRTFCSFGLEKRGGERLVDAIRPGRFVVRRGSRSWYAARDGEPAPVRVAALELAALEIEAGPGNRYTFYTELPLRSPEQPQVEDLRCQYDGVAIDRRLGRYPGLAEIRAALGGLATVTHTPGGQE